MPAENNGGGVLSNVLKLLPVYAIYVFIAGWTYSDFYLRSFGVNPAWFDADFHDLLTRGFTIVFGSKLLLWIYVVMVATPLAAEVVYERWGKLRWFLDLLLATAFGILLLLTYQGARDAGTNQAKVDQGDQSTLPVINLTIKQHYYVGHLLFLKNQTYYVHRLKDVTPGISVPRVLEMLSIFRAEEVSDVTIVEIPKE
jgi:predicted outer membrane lipoprotein